MDVKIGDEVTAKFRVHAIQDGFIWVLSLGAPSPSGDMKGHCLVAEEIA